MVIVVDEYLESIGRLGNEHIAAGHRIVGIDSIGSLNRHILGRENKSRSSIELSVERGRIIHIVEIEHRYSTPGREMRKVEHGCILYIVEAHACNLIGIPGPGIAVGRRMLREASM